jgi:2-dehydropantoate 2-reductase
MRWKYAKLLMNLGNAIEAVCGIVEQSELHERAIAEGKAVLHAAGIAYASADEEQARRGDVLRRRPHDDPQLSGGSAWQSLMREAGSVETDFLNGEIVLLGRLHNVASPINALLQRLAHEAAQAGSKPGSHSPEEILELAATRVRPDRA